MEAISKFNAKKLSHLSKNEMSAAREMLTCLGIIQYGLRHGCGGSADKISVFCLVVVEKRVFVALTRVVRIPLPLKLGISDLIKKTHEKQSNQGTQTN